MGFRVRVRVRGRLTEKQRKMRYDAGETKFKGHVCTFGNV